MSMARFEPREAEEPAGPRRKRVREEEPNALVEEAFADVQDELLYLQDGISERMNGLRSRLIRFFEEDRSMGLSLRELLLQQDSLYISRMTFLGRCALKHYTAEFLRERNFVHPHFLTLVRSQAYACVNVSNLWSILGVDAVLGVEVPNYERYYHLLAELDQFSKENAPNIARPEVRIEAAYLRDQLVDMLFRLSSHRVNLIECSDRVILLNHKRVKY